MTPRYKTIWLGKNIYPYESQQFEPFKYIRRYVHTNVFYLMNKKQALSSQSKLQMFSLIPGRHIGGPRKLYTVALNASTNKSETMYLTDLRIGEVVKRFVSYSIPNSWPFSFNDSEFIFLLRNSVNDARSEMKNRVSYRAS